jgi:HAD superfamily hydrolase (TIGR01509 family)
MLDEPFFTESCQMITSNPAYPRRRYAALIFDCDGTLTDSMPLHYVAWSRTLRRYGVAFPEERFYALGGMPSKQIVRLLAGEHGVEVDAHVAAHEKEGLFMNLIQHLAPITEVIDVARHFRGQLPMAVASGGYRHIIHHQLTQIGISDWFDTIVTAEDTVRHKPDPDVFLLAAQRMGVSPEACLVYEDSSLGIDAAKSAGMDFVDIRSFYTPRRYDC